MAYKDSHGLTIIEGLEPIRLRPGMYIGAVEAHPSQRARLLENAVSAIACDIAHQRPQEVRILLWRDDAVTIAYDGVPLPIEQSSFRTDGVSHPALYRSFMYMIDPAMFAMAILNALSERLVVSTMRGGDRYRTTFSKGTIVALLHRAGCDQPVGSTWLTYLPDTTVVAGEVLTAGDVRGIAARVGQNAEGVRIRVEDRMTEDADWN